MDRTDRVNPKQPVSPPGTPVEVDQQLCDLNSLLGDLDEAPDGIDVVQEAMRNQLVQVRLGLASSLFMALRVRHAPTADHSLRVALGCSAWAMARQMSAEERDELEVAALLHDIGKIGVSDSILRKPTALTSDQAAVMNRSNRYALHVLASCCVSQRMLQIVEHVGAWYDGTRRGFRLVGEDLPLASRMITIVDAYDAMTTNRVYRKAMPSERALAELFTFAGSQFDPALVADFANQQATGRSLMQGPTTQRWLQSLSAKTSNRFWQLRNPPRPLQSALEPFSDFQEQLFNLLHDGVVFVDARLDIVRWNRGAERLTGMLAESVEHRRWQPVIIGLRHADGRIIKEADCPVAHCIKSGSQSFQRLLIAGRDGEILPVDVQCLPVIDDVGFKGGATVVLRDASSETLLKERVQSLHEKAIRDSLTGVANRAEFDRVFAEAIRRHVQKGLPCSLIICDIDRFKGINDQFGHQAGDEALVSFATLLRRSCRHGDLVARYGGEEFVMVCEACSSQEATQVAEKVRQELAQTPLAELNGQFITASFGVTELQPGDTVETMLRRADRGLLMAKDSGRNRVVQLGTGMVASQVKAKTLQWWSSWLRPSVTSKLVEEHLSTNVPLNVAVQKLYGFVADHDADIVSIRDNQMVLRISVDRPVQQRRRSDRPQPLRMQLEFSELETAPKNDRAAHGLRITAVHVSIRPERQRDRRHNPAEAARNLLISLKSYLMAQHYDPSREGHRILSGGTMLQRAVLRWRQ
jgi:diguanylate cyclase (GGDEF)-like protein